MKYNKLATSLGRKFTFTVANASASDNVIYILNGWFNALSLAVTQAGTTPFAVSAVTPSWNNILPLTNAGYPTGSVLDDGTIATDITATPAISTLKIRQWKEQVKFYPQACNKITMSVDNVEQFNEQIYIGSLDMCLKTTQEVALTVDNYLDRYQQITTKVDIPFNDNKLILDASTLMYFTLRDGRSATFTFFFD